MAQYRYAENQNYEDFASGRVFVNAPGQPAFPVRLASEAFQRSLARWRAKGGDGRVTLYDPTCGGAYHLAVLAYLHWEDIGCIVVSDVDAEVLALAERNLGLLALDGLGVRIAEIERMLADYQKDSHAAALQSAQMFQTQLTENLRSHKIETRLFQADATDPQVLETQLVGENIDIVFSDVPYGMYSHWKAVGDEPPVVQMLAALQPSLTAHSVVAIAADKGQKVAHPAYRRVERFNMGKRRITLLELAE
ncbi:MAG: hypothetical protein JXB38_20765 [Anaerolineales bacterium]|nr:hypothetical protein [Anaerolineales bacterium]